MKMFLLPEDLRRELLTFMMQQPYALVAKGVEKLQGLAEASSFAIANTTPPTNELMQNLHLGEK